MEQAPQPQQSDEGPRSPALLKASQLSNLLLLAISSVGILSLLCCTLKNAYGVLGAAAVLALAGGMVWVTAKLDEADERKWDEIDKEIKEEFEEEQAELRKQCERELEERLVEMESFLRQQGDTEMQAHASDRARRHEELQSALKEAAERVSVSAHADGADADAGDVLRESIASQAATVLQLEEADAEEDDTLTSKVEQLLQSAERGRAVAELQVQRRQIERIRRLREQLKKVQLPDAAAGSVVAEDAESEVLSTDMPRNSADEVVEALASEVRVEAGQAVADAMRRASLLRHRRGAGGAAPAAATHEPS